MNCDVLSLADLDDIDLTYIRRNLTKPDSDFHRKLRRGQTDGHIAIVRDQGEIVGWARTEPWMDCEGFQWDTLEAFVSVSYRLQGIAAFAACGLESARTLGCGVAVFHPVMYVIATRVGVKPTLFAKGEAWVRA